VGWGGGGGCRGGHFGYLWVNFDLDLPFKASPKVMRGEWPALGEVDEVEGAAEVKDDTSRA
jgi:hypothetical protein